MKRLLISLNIALIIPALMPLTAAASSQSFSSLQPVQSGMLMSLTSNSGVIEPATVQNAKSLVGVVAPSDETAFDQQPGQTSVRTDGAASALVSTLNGDINVGDRIAPSSVVGIGAKLSGSGEIVGTAQGSLDSHTQGAVKTLVSDSKGGRHTVYVASIPILVKVSYYQTPVKPSVQNDQLAESLQKLADKLAGKHASLVVLIIAGIILIVGIYISGSIVNSAVRGGMLAIARQPLTKSLVQRKILQSVGVALLIVAVAIAVGLILLRIF